MRKKKGFTLVEILISTAIMAFTITAVLQILHNLVRLNESNDTISAGMNEIQGIMDQVRNSPFDDVVPVYNGRNFTVAGLTNTGVEHQGTIEIFVLDPDVLRIKISVSWRQRTIVLGEDQNLNGVLDSGEDVNGNGELDSPCMMAGAVMFH